MPNADETAEVLVEEPKVEGPAETTEVSEEVLEETPEENLSGEESPEKKETSDSRLDKIMAENKAMRDQLSKSEERFKELESKMDQAQPKTAPVEASKTPSIDYFLQKTLPQAKKYYAREDVSLEDQFTVNFETADALLGAVMRDRIAPTMANIYTRTVNIAAENEFLRLSLENEEFREYAPEIRKALKGLTVEQKEKENAVYELFLREKGARPKVPKKESVEGESPEKESKGVIRDQLRDLAAGSGRGASPSGKTSIRLTPEQESERQKMESDGMFMPPEMYASQLLARRKVAKEKGSKIPTTLAGWA